LSRNCNDPVVGEGHRVEGAGRRVDDAGADHADGADVAALLPRLGNRRAQGGAPELDARRSVEGVEGVALRGDEEHVVASAADGEPREVERLGVDVTVEPGAEGGHATEASAHRSRGEPGLAAVGSRSAPIELEGRDGDPGGRRSARVAGRRAHVDGGSAYVAGRRTYVDGRRAYVAGRRTYVAGRRTYVAAYVNGGSAYVNGGSAYVNAGSAYVNGGDAYVNSGDYLRQRRDYLRRS
jgi:hypothetical protein